LSSKLFALEVRGAFFKECFGAFGLVLRSATDAKQRRFKEQSFL
jgi:hypothetical protein